MPKSVKKFKNSNKTNNKIHITINNKSSSRRKRKGKSKAGLSSIQPHYGNAIPTIIQMHQPQPTLSQIADNRYGIGMSEKIDALAGGMTRVLENIENKQQDYYTRENNKALLSNALTNRKEELANQLIQDQTSSTVSNHTPALQALPPPLNMNDSQQPSGLNNANSGFDGGLDDEQNNFNHENIYDNLDNKSFSDENPRVKPAPHPKGMTVAQYNKELKKLQGRQRYAEKSDTITKRQLREEKKALKEAEIEAKKEAKLKAKLAKQQAAELESANIGKKEKKGKKG